MIRSGLNDSPIIQLNDYALIEQWGMYKSNAIQLKLSLSLIEGVNLIIDL